MLKKLLFLFLFNSFAVFAANPECAVKPSYDIVISKQNVHIFNNKNDLVILPTGKIIFNHETVLPSSQLKKNILKFQRDLRQQLPQLELQALNLLDEVNKTFDKAITLKLDNDDDLHGQLKKLYKRLVKLLQQSIITQNDETQFNYKNFNNLKKDGEDIGQRIFYNIVGNSILHFNLFKNYGAIKKISKDEWKTQKPKLKAFDSKICTVITHIDEQYQKILSELSQSIDK